MSSVDVVADGSERPENSTEREEEEAPVGGEDQPVRHVLAVELST